MSNEDFLKAAADRAQVGSSAEVAQNAKHELAPTFGPPVKFYRANVETVEIHIIADAEYRKACVDGNP